MASVMGENALCYINGVKLPLANEWSIDIEQEKVEAPRTFVCPDDGASNWITKSGGYFSASGSISCLYDSADQAHIDYVLADAAYPVLLYPECTPVRYWSGNAWVTLGMSVPVDGYVTVDYDFESNGQWQWVD